MEDGYGLAYMRVGGSIRTDHTDFDLAGRKLEKGAIAYHSLHGVFAVTNDNMLVAWDPVSNRSRILSAQLPKPTRVIKVAPNGRQVFFLAGDMNQKGGISTWSGSDWVTKPLPYAGVAIVDADVDWERGLVLLMCRDRCLRLLALETEKILGEIRYESVPDVSIRGAPARCALSSSDSESYAYLATSHGHIACWNWRTNALMRLEDYCALTENVNLILFESLTTQGHLFFSTHVGGKVISRHPRRIQKDRHAVTVTDCVLTDSGKIVSFCEQEQTVRWFDADGLRPAGLRVITAPSTIARTCNSDDVLVGTREGLVMRITRDGETKEGEGFPSLREFVVTLFAAENGETIAAGKSGKVVRFRLPSLDHEVIRHATGRRTQHQILPADPRSLFLSVHEDSERGGITWAVTLADISGREERIFSTSEKLGALAVNADGSALCVAGKTVKILRRVQRGWAVTHSRDVAAEHVTFLRNGALVAVAPADVTWIEIWKADGAMETIAAIEVPAEVSCLSALKDRIAVGLRSGFLLSLELRSSAN